MAVRDPFPDGLGPNVSKVSGIDKVPQFLRTRRALGTCRIEAPSSLRIMRKVFAGLLSVALYAHALAYEDDISKPSIANDVRRKKVEYGAITVQPRSEDNGMFRWKKEVDPPCSDCVITVMSANLEYPDGTTADATNGMWLHHIVFLNKANLDGTCGEKKPGQRFWGAGNERTPLDLTDGG